MQPYQSGSPTYPGQSAYTPAAAYSGQPLPVGAFQPTGSGVVAPSSQPFYTGASRSSAYPTGAMAAATGQPTMPGASSLSYPSRTVAWVPSSQGMPVAMHTTMPGMSASLPYAGAQGQQTMLPSASAMQPTQPGLAPARAPMLVSMTGSVPAGMPVGYAAPASAAAAGFSHTHYQAAMGAASVPAMPMGSHLSMTSPSRAPMLVSMTGSVPAGMPVGYAAPASAASMTLSHTQYPSSVGVASVSAAPAGSTQLPREKTFLPVASVAASVAATAFLPNVPVPAVSERAAPAVDTRALVARARPAVSDSASSADGATRDESFRAATIFHTTIGSEAFRPSMLAVTSIPRSMGDLAPAAAAAAAAASPSQPALSWSPSAMPAGALVAASASQALERSVGVTIKKPVFRQLLPTPEEVACFRTWMCDSSPNLRDMNRDIAVDVGVKFFYRMLLSLVDELPSLRPLAQKYDALLTLAQALASLNKNPLSRSALSQIDQWADQLTAQAQALPVGDFLLYPLSVHNYLEGQQVRHTMMGRLRRGPDGSFEFAIVNEGAGLANHVRFSDAGQTRFAPAYVVEGIQVSSLKSLMSIMLSYAAGVHHLQDEPELISYYQDFARLGKVKMSPSSDYPNKVDRQQSVTDTMSSQKALLAYVCDASTYEKFMTSATRHLTVELYQACRPILYEVFQKLEALKSVSDLTNRRKVLQVMQYLRQATTYYFSLTRRGFQTLGGYESFDAYISKIALNLDRAKIPPEVKAWNPFNAQRESALYGFCEDLNAYLIDNHARLGANKERVYRCMMQAFASFMRDGLQAAGIELEDHLKAALDSENIIGGAGKKLNTDADVAQFMLAHRHAAMRGTGAEEGLDVRLKTLCLE